MKRILFDTDIGGDCDDAGALGMVLEAEKHGLCKLIGITLSTSSPYAAGCADAICAYYNVSAPIGSIARTPQNEDPSQFPVSYGREICERFPRRVSTQPSVRLMRKLLAESEEKVTLIVIGSCVNLEGLLNSKGDDLSPKSGVELVREKVDEVSLMGCFFPTEEAPDVRFADGYVMRAEFNIKADIPSAQTVFSRCPVPIVVSHYLVGLNIRIGASLIKKDRKNPVAVCYEVHSHGDRESWDPVSAYYALFGADGAFFLGKEGKVTIDDEGVSAFAEGEGLHRLIECNDFQAAKVQLEKVLLGEDHRFAP